MFRFTILPSSPVTSSRAPLTCHVRCLFPGRWDLHRDSDCGMRSSARERRLVGRAAGEAALLTVHSAHGGFKGRLLSNSLPEDPHGLLPQNDSESLNQGILKCAPILTSNSQKNVFIFYGCYNKLPQTRWLDTTLFP